jgi:hypothetical protein
VIAQAERIYTLGELCEALSKKGHRDIQPHNSRYLEKVLKDVLDIHRDEYLNRLYTEAELNKIVSALGLKGQAQNYDFIKGMSIKMHTAEEDGEYRKAAEESISELQIVEEKSIVTGPTIEDLRLFMSEIMSSSLQSTVVPELQNLKKDLTELKLQNTGLKASLEKQQEEHYRQIDLKLTKWREDSLNKRKPWYKKVFR